MIRGFETHRIREQKELDGLWDVFVEEKEKAVRLPVPSCWEQHPELMGYRGTGVYRKTVFLKQPGNLRLEFKGVSHTAEVFFDGEQIAGHYNAYTPFSAVVKNAAAGEHELTVRVDNTFGEHSALHIPNDYYTYGGITRPVAMETVPDVYLKRLRFLPEHDGSWKGTVQAVLQSLSDRERTVTVKTELAGKKGEQTVTLGPGEEKTAVFSLSFENIRPWSPEDPALYLLTAVLSEDGRETDDLIERVGFRTVETRGEKLLLNGEPITFLGVNRHEDYAVDGCAVSVQHMVQDLDLIREMNANAVRTCHYPNDERFLDLCDERGILVWEENHARGLSLEQMQNPHFEKQCEDCIREMAENHVNHPSIVIWGILNECASHTEEGREMYRKQYGQLRELDPSRPRTSATCQHFTDLCLDLPEIVSVNLYFGWYVDKPVRESAEEEFRWIDSAGGKGKPLIVSEFGAGAVYGYRDRSRCKWSEERQADVIRECLECYLHDPRLSGVFLWQFADCRITEEEGWFASRARSHNNKGLVDEYRRPKLAFDTVKEIFGKTARRKDPSAPADPD